MRSTLSTALTESKFPKLSYSCVCSLQQSRGRTLWQARLSINRSDRVTELPSELPYYLGSLGEKTSPKSIWRFRVPGTVQITLFRWSQLAYSTHLFVSLTHHTIGSTLITQRHYKWYGSHHQRMYTKATRLGCHLMTISSHTHRHKHNTTSDTSSYVAIDTNISLSSEYSTG